LTRETQDERKRGREVGGGGGDDDNGDGDGGVGGGRRRSTDAQNKPQLVETLNPN